MGHSDVYVIRMYTEIYYLHLDDLDKYGGSIRLVIIIGTGYM